jgi:hypothetical protein
VRFLAALGGALAEAVLRMARLFLAGVLQVRGRERCQREEREREREGV